MALVCTIATTANIDATYSVINQNPTLTLNSTGVLTVDGRDILVGDIILVKDQVSLEQNGVYQCYVRGDTGVAAVLVLYYNFSTPTKINNCGIINVIFGTINQNTGWVINAIITSIGVDEIEFNPFLNNMEFDDAQIQVKVPLLTNAGLDTKTITFTGTALENSIVVPENIPSLATASPEFVLSALDIKDTDGVIYHTIISTTERPQNSFPVESDFSSPITAEQLIAITPAEYGTLDDSSTASQSGTTVTGIGTTFPPTCAGGNIFWPAISRYATITQYNSATSLTVSPSQSISAGSFVIYYGGINIDNLGIRLLDGQTIQTNNIDCPNSGSGVGTTLSIGATNATVVNISNANNIGFTGGSGNNKITLPVELSTAFKITDGALDYISVASFSTQPAVNILKQQNNSSVIISSQALVLNSTSLSFIASQSGTTVTSTSGTFTSAMIGGVIYWGATNNWAVITAVASGTSITVNKSQSVASNACVIYYAGANIDNTGLRFLNNQTITANNLDTPATALGVGTTLALGATNATAITLRGQAISLAGSFTTSGANALTLTTTGTTNVTLPTSGTLATTAGTVSSVTGTSNRITSSGGTTPAIDISVSYVGQSSITTLGTISTGTWQGTVVGATYGGTGVNNGSSTITLGGSLTLSGAFTTALTVSANTSLTLPTSGTLATTSRTGTVSWSNKTNGSSSTNTTITSASTSSPLLYGAMTEVAFDSICINGAVSSNFSGTTALSQNAFGGFLACQSANANNGNQITYQTPGNLAVGVYMVEYYLVFGNISCICDVSYKANGAGAFSALRTGVDLYTSVGDGYNVSFNEFITITTAGNPLSIKWTANGKNASSSNFWIRPSGWVRVTLLG